MMEQRLTFLNYVLSSSQHHLKEAVSFLLFIDEKIDVQRYKLKWSKAKQKCHTSGAEAVVLW